MLTPAFTLPTDYNRIKLVQSFDELVTTPFANGVNALCWHRNLSGDFGEIVNQLAVGNGITNVDQSRLNSLSVSPSGQIAIDILLEDQRLLSELGVEPNLDCINGYLRDENPGPIATDVYSFHADSATDQADTYLCTYYGFPSEGLRNDEAIRYVDVRETRAKLLEGFGGEDNDEFREYLRENCYDLHYAPLPHARPFSFGVGNLWRIAVDYPGSPVPPCIHRAPEDSPGQSPRLLLIC
jgi:hypothetical protein